MDEQHDIALDAILGKIQAEVRARTQNGSGTARPMPSVTKRSEEPQPSFKTDGDAQTSLECLLAFRDDEFIHVAYRELLHREPDPSGLAHYLRLLRTGLLTRIEILVAIRFSQEGRQVGVRIPGLTRSYWTGRISKLPVIGYLVQVVYGVLRLPAVIRGLSTLDAEMALRFSALRRRTSITFHELLDRAQRTAANAEEFHHHLARLEFAKANRNELASLEDRVISTLSLKADQQEVEALAAQVEAKGKREELSALPGKVDPAGTSKIDRHHSTAIEGLIPQSESSRVDPNQVASLDDKPQIALQQIAVCRKDLQDQHRRLGILLELVRMRLPEAFTTQQVTKLLVEEGRYLDSLHVAFEDKFRANREAVLEAFKVYLPYVERIARKEGKKLPLLDVACGRGEWLELLRRHGHSAKGVDINRSALEQCKDLGLDVVEEDAVEFLRKQPENAFSAITCFHYLEHLDFKSLVALLDESLRVLMPGGLAIFETPNARNILVSAGNFYRDPTYRNLVFPDTMESFAELRGFAESTAYCFNDTRTGLIPIAKFAFNDPNTYVSFSRDIAWIGAKPL